MLWLVCKYAKPRSMDAHTSAISSSLKVLPQTLITSAMLPAPQYSITICRSRVIDGFVGHHDTRSGARTHSSPFVKWLPMYRTMKSLSHRFKMSISRNSSPKSLSPSTGTIFTATERCVVVSNACQTVPNDLFRA